jgi:hypothetical protein
VAPLLPERVGGVADLPLAAQEHQDVARPPGAQLVDRVADRLGLVAVAVVGQRPVADLHREDPAGDLQHRRAAEVPGEPLGVDGRRGDDHLQVRPAGQQPPQVAEEEVDVEAAFVRLVDDQRVVLAQQPVVLDLGKEDAVGHQLDPGAVADLVGEPHLVADRATQRRSQLRRDPLGHRPRRQPARLGVPDHPVAAASQLQAELGELGGLPRAGLAGDDHHLVVADHGQDLVLALADRQRRRVAQLHGAHALRSRQMHSEGQRRDQARSSASR